MLFEIKNIQYSITKKKILPKQNIRLKYNENLLIIGPSGCGKTTLINLMAGLLQPTSGEIIFENQKFSSLSDYDIDIIRSENFGFIFQKLHLIQHLNVEQNIKLAQTKNVDLDIDETLKELGLYKKKKETVRNLSLGEAQRVAIARGVANNPKVIFADEPTSSLDDTNAKKVIDLIFKLKNKKKISLILSTHDKRMEKYFSKIIKM